MGQMSIDHSSKVHQADLQKHSVLIDTDIGDDIDDALALALALRSPEIELHGVTTVFGDTQLRAGLAAHLLHVFGREDVPVPEWNVRSDAKAARMVLAAGIPVTMLGWNVTTRCQLCEEDIERLHSDGSAQTRLLSRLLAAWQRHRPRWHPSLPYLHDPLAVLALCSPELLQFEEMTARIFVHGPLRGYMVPRVLDGPLVRAAVGVDAEEARAMVMQRLLSPLPLQIS